MPDKNKTEIVAVLDRSGSMRRLAGDMIGGFGSLIDEQKKVPGDCSVSLYQFDDRFDTVYEGKDINDVGPLKLVPRGQTALLDAVGRSIANTIERHDAMPEEQRPGAVIFLIITDGAENDSHEWSKERVQEALKDAEDNRGWQMVFMAADAKAFNEAQNYGFNAGRMGQVAANTMGIGSAYGATSEALRSYRSNVSKGIRGASLNVDQSKLKGS